MEQLLLDVSAQNKVTPQVFVNNIVKGWLESQLRGLYKNYFSKASLEELKTLVADYTKLKAYK